MLGLLTSTFALFQDALDSDSVIHRCEKSIFNNSPAHRNATQAAVDITPRPSCQPALSLDFVARRASAAAVSAAASAGPVPAAAAAIGAGAGAALNLGAGASAVACGPSEGRGGRAVNHIFLQRAHMRQGRAGVADRKRT